MRTQRGPLKRRIVSRVACLMGNALVPVHDATSGFFALRRSVIDGVHLNPDGAKYYTALLVQALYAPIPKAGH